ncbi:MAG: riboflavin kinase [Bacteroidota bacterium]|nr:riboflavin kinase [Bacteroidota bacterium]
MYVKYFLREEKKFDGLEELKKAINEDKIAALKYLSEP